MQRCSTSVAICAKMEFFICEIKTTVMCHYPLTRMKDFDNPNCFEDMKNWVFHTILMGIKNCMATLENNLAVS